MIEGLRRRFQARRLDAPRSPARFGAHYDPDAFGRVSEGIARFFGTARYLVFQTVMVISWIVIGYGVLGWDHSPSLFLLNLAFSTQAAYAAPLILLAQNRQAERDRIRAEEDRLVNTRVAPLAGQDRGHARARGRATRALRRARGGRRARAGRVKSVSRPTMRRAPAPTPLPLA